jgi:BASS family bile acid:Na+ symporter
MLDFFTHILLPMALFAMMFGVGISLQTTDVVRVSKKPRALLAGVFSLMALGPFVAFGISRVLDLSSDLTVGLVLLASCPGGLFSNYMTALARGALALSICLTAGTTLVYVVVGPLWAEWAMHNLNLGTGPVLVPYAQIFKPLLQFLLLPVALGMLFRTYSSPRIAIIAQGARDAGGILAILCYGVIVYTQRDSFFSNLLDSLPPVLLFDAAMIAIALVLSALLRLNLREIPALLIEHLIRQEATGIYIATAVIGSLSATLPMLINSISGTLMSLLIVVIFRRLIR